MSAHGAAHQPALGSQPRDELLKERVFKALLFFSLAVGLITLGALLITVLAEAAPRLSVNTIINFPSSLPARAGLQSAIWGTIWVMVLVALMTIPVGVGAAIYLEEYADRDRWYNRAIEVNIQNLAAVPSIVYGILGLGIIARGAFNLGQVLLTGAITLSLLVLPIVIISSREAIRAVPNSIRQGALALGATQWQMIRREVLPAAIPGMATGSILALSRAIGEAAPLVLLGALTFITFNPSGLDSQFSVLPIQIFNYIQQSQDEFKHVAAVGIVVLLALLITMNAAAIYIRNRYQRRW